VRCSECGGQTVEGTQFCALCGAPVSRQRSVAAASARGGFEDAIAVRQPVSPADGQIPQDASVGEQTGLGHPRRRVLVIAGVCLGAVLALVVVGQAGHSSGHKPASAHKAASVTTGLMAALTDPYGVSVFTVAFSPDGRMLAASDEQGSTYLWNVATRHQIAELDDPTYWIGSNYSVAFSPDGRTLASGRYQGSSYLWNVATRHLIATLNDPKGSGVNSVAFSPHGRMLAAGDGNGSTYLWDVATRHLITDLTDPGRAGVVSVAFSPNGQTLAAGNGKGSIYLWDVATRHLITGLTDPGRAGVNSVAFSPNGRTLATGDYQGGTYLWDVRTRHQIAMLNGPFHNSVNSVAFSPDGRTLATSGADGSIYLWDVATGRLVATHTDPGARGIYSVAFSPDGRILAAADTNGSIYLWHVRLPPRVPAKSPPAEGRESPRGRLTLLFRWAGGPHKEDARTRTALSHSATDAPLSPILALLPTGLRSSVSLGSCRRRGGGV